LTSSTKSQSCGCPNMMTLLGDKVTAMDLNEVVLLKTENNSKNSHTLTRNDLEYKENPRKRKVLKLDLEVR
jgi:hypothetical protein